MKFSIITVNYNNKEGLRRTIESVIHQTYRDFEYIVIDGGSTDGSREVIEEYTERIDYWVSEPDKGIYNAMNKGISVAHGEYLNFMNSGDIFYDYNRLNKISEQQFQSDIIIGRDYWYNSKTGKDFSTILPLRLEMFTFYKGSLPHQSSLFKRIIFKEGKYDESLKVVSDWKFYIQAIIEKGCSVSYFQDVICERDNKDGIGYSMQAVAKEERDSFITSFLPIGIRRHYETLNNLDTSTFYKLMIICDDKKLVKFLTLAIKLIYKIGRVKK